LPAGIYKSSPGLPQKSLAGLLLCVLCAASSQDLVFVRRFSSTPKEFANLPTLSALLIPNNAVIPGLSLRSNPGLKLANAFGVNG
jgi:hypothetical protein